jgi:putative phosphoserine phosphatase/1-acylglycerol-3-phosphate O-acyltransferase
MSAIPGFRAIGGVAGVAFDDRDLEASVRTARMSVLAAPEGTRVAGQPVGPFESGPFRIALAARVPVIPIVIRNAEVLGSRSSSVVRPGTVDVAVLAPVAPRGGVEDLAERVRRQFVDTLVDWPTG